MGVGPMTVNATAAKIVTAMQTLYHVGVNRTLVTEQLVEAFSYQISTLAGQPLSLQAQHNWFKQLQDAQLQNR